MIRRVYQLSNNLHERITAFMHERNISEEVAAIRILLNQSLDLNETSVALIARLKPLSIEEIQRIACGHPLVREMRFDRGDGSITINFADDNGATFSEVHHGSA